MSVATYPGIGYRTEANARAKAEGAAAFVAWGYSGANVLIPDKSGEYVRCECTDGKCDATKHHPGNRQPHECLACEGSHFRKVSDRPKVGRCLIDPGPMEW